MHGKTKRKIYSVSVVVGSSLYDFLEQNKNNSKWFCEVADYYLEERVGLNDIKQQLDVLAQEISTISNAVKNGVSIKSEGIGNNRPQIGRGRR